MSEMLEVKLPKNQDDEISIFDLVAFLWKRKKIIIGITAATMVAVLIYTIGSLILPVDKSYLPNVYTPKATMVIQTNNTSGGISALLSASGLSDLAGIAGVGTGGNTNGALAEVLAISNSTLDALELKFLFSSRVKNKNKEPLISDVRKGIKKNLNAKLDSTTNIFTVSFTDIDPVLAKNVVDETVNILEARFASLSGDKTLQQKELLEKKLAEVDNSVKELEAKVKSFQTKYGVIHVDALATEQITILARLRTELIMKEMEISNYAMISRVDDPKMLQLRFERDAFLAKIKEIETGIGSGSKVMPSQKELPTIAFEYARLQRDLLVQTELFKLLTQQYELAKLSSAGQDPVFQVLEMAEVPDKKSGPSRGMICIIVSTVGFFFSILLAFMVELVDRMRNDPEAVARFKALSTKNGVIR